MKRLSNHIMRIVFMKNWNIIVVNLGKFRQIVAHCFYEELKPTGKHKPLAESLKRIVFMKNWNAAFLLSMYKRWTRIVFMKNWNESLNRSFVGFLGMRIVFMKNWNTVHDADNGKDSGALFLWRIETPGRSTPEQGQPIGRIVFMKNWNIVICYLTWIPLSNGRIVFMKNWNIFLFLMK